jgi:hypothetical protein
MTGITTNPKQSRNKKILIAGIGVIALCLIVCGVAYFGFRGFVNRQVKVDPIEFRNLALQITDYALPRGYKEMGGSTLLGIVTAVITDETETNMIWLMQTPIGSLPDPQDYLQDAIASQYSNPVTWTAEDIQIYIVRGEKSSVTLYRGVAEDGKNYRAWAGKFAGKGGPAIFVIVGPQETWDEGVAETFIQSMR